MKAVVYRGRDDMRLEEIEEIGGHHTYLKLSEREIGMVSPYLKR